MAGSGYRPVTDSRARARVRVRQRREVGAGQTIGFPTSDFTPVAPTAPTASIGFPTADFKPSTPTAAGYRNYEVDPRMGYSSAIDSATVPSIGFPSPNFQTSGRPSPTGGFLHSNWTEPPTPPVPNLYGFEQAEEARFGRIGEQGKINYQNQMIAQREQDASQFAAAARGQTAALQAQAEMMRAQRDAALQQGLSATAAEYDDRLAAIDREIAKLNADAQNNEDVSAWLRQQMQRPFDLAAAAAQAIDTAGATAATEAALANMTQAKLESDERLQSMLSDIGFTGLVGEIGIQAAQDMVAQESSFNERLGVIEAAGAYQQEMADFQKDLMIAGADEIEAAFMREDETGRLLASVKIREALSDLDYDRNKMEAAKERALQQVRDQVYREYGEGVRLGSESDFVSAALRAQWDVIAADLPDDQLGAYMDMLGEIEALGIDPNDSQQVVALLQAAREDDPTFDFDNEDIAILRQLAAVRDAAYEEYRAVQQYQGSSTGANNRDPYNIAEVERWMETGEITGPYAQRAAMAEQLAGLIRQSFPGVPVQGVRYNRPLETQQQASDSGRAHNSDHHTAGALDIFFPPGSQNTAQYQEMVGYINTLKQQGVIQSVVWLGDNAAHKDHIHVSLALPYGGQQDFMDVSGGFNQSSYGNETLDQAVDATPNSQIRGPGVS